jgi:hypothetical protein
MVNAMSRGPVLLIIGVVCVISGLFISWPLVRAAWQYKAVAGHITNVLIIPENETHSRVLVSFDYPTNGKREITMGHQLVNERLEPIADPLLPHAQATRLAEQLTGRSVRVFFPANQQADAAFMLSPVSDDRGLRPEQGAVIVIIGLVCSILAQMTRLRRP